MGDVLEHLRAEAVATNGVVSWGSLQLVALLAFFLVLRRGPKRALVGGSLGALLGATLLLPLLRLPSLLHGASLAALGPFGITAYGALAGCAGGYALGARAAKEDVAYALDRLAPALGLLLLFGRVGCFVAGCDFGAPTSLPWGVRYGVDTPCLRAQLDQGLVALGATVTLPVHPTQLYEAALGLVMVAAGAAIARIATRPGAAFATTAAIYAVGRAAIDLVRGDASHGSFAAPSTSQSLSLLVVALVVLWLANARGAAPSEPPALPLVPSRARRRRAASPR